MVSMSAPDFPNQFRSKGGKIKRLILNPPPQTKPLFTASVQRDSPDGKRSDFRYAGNKQLASVFFRFLLGKRPMHIYNSYTRTLR